MTKGLGKFEYYFIVLDTILQKAERTKNPALYLYQNDGRTKAFMLEGLAKLYAELHNKKKFTKIKDSYKAIEDLLGKIDHYDAFAKNFAASKTIPTAVKKYFTDKKVLHIDELNKILLRKKWIGHSPTRTDKQRKRIKKADWQKAEAEIVSLKKEYQSSIESIKKFYTECGTVFTDMETQVHEIRRKLRWLSIYPHALQGSIQLASSNSYDKAVKKYLIKEIVSSPYNKMPAKGNNEFVLNLNQNYFYALSFVIAALGNIKDQGLQIEGLAEALMVTEKLAKESAIKKALTLTKQKTNQIELLLKEATTICKTFFDENNLEKMLNN